MNNTFRDIALPTGRQHPTHPNSKPPALIPTLKKNTPQSQEIKLPQNNFCPIEPQNVLTDQGPINLAQISPQFNQSINFI